MQGCNLKLTTAALLDVEASNFSTPDFWENLFHNESALIYLNSDTMGLHMAHFYTLY